MDGWKWHVFVLMFDVALVTAQQCANIFISEANHVLQAGAILSIYPLTAAQCADKCRKHKTCRSFNYGIKGQYVRKRCELRSYTRQQQPNHYHENENFVHYHLYVEPRYDKGSSKQNEPNGGVCAAAVSPCKNNATCKEVCTYKKFECLCQRSNYAIPPDNLCEGWQGYTSDFDVYFDGNNVDDYIKQNLSTTYPQEGRIVDLMFLAWIKMDSTFKEEHTLLSIVSPENKTVFSVRFYEVNDTRKTKVIIREEVYNGQAVPKSSWFLLVIRWKVQQGQSGSVEIQSRSSGSTSYDLYAQFLSKKSRIFIGQELAVNSSQFDQELSFRGYVSRLNVWEDPWVYTSTFFNKYIDGRLTSNADLPWPMFWDFYGPCIHGDVKKLECSEVKRVWKEVTAEKITISEDGLTNYYTLTNDSSGLAQIHVDPQNDLHCEKTRAMVVAVKGEWKRLKYKLEVTGRQQCYGIMGGILDGSSISGSWGLLPWDARYDMIYDEVNMGTSAADGGFNGNLSSCDNSHFWTNTAAGPRNIYLSQRRKDDATEAGIAVFSRCGTGGFKITNIRALEC